MSLEKLLHGDFEYVGIYVHKTFLGIAYIILIAYYPIINEFKMHVNAIVCLCVFIQRLIFSGVYEIQYWGWKYMCLAGNTIEIIKNLAFLKSLFVVMLEMLHFKCAIREQRKTNFTPMALAFWLHMHLSYFDSKYLPIRFWPLGK